MGSQEVLGSQASRETKVTPACPGSSSGPPPNVSCSEYLAREVPKRHSNQILEPSYLVVLNTKEQRLDSRMTERFTLSIRESLETNFGRCWMVELNFFKAVCKLFSMALPNPSHGRDRVHTDPLMVEHGIRYGQSVN